jgi:hypothetical protein
MVPIKPTAEKIPAIDASAFILCSLIKLNRTTPILHNPDNIIPLRVILILSKAENIITGIIALITHSLLLDFHLKLKSSF